MGIYNQSQTDLFFGLLQSENPNLASAKSSQFKIDKITAGSGVITTARLRGVSNHGYTGVQTITYNRIAIQTLFSNVPLTITQFTAAKLSDLIPGLNAKYGLNILPSDVTTDTVIPAGTTSAFYTLILNGLQYNGAITLSYTRGVKQLTDYYPLRTLTSLILPDAMLSAFKVDFTDQSSTLTAHDPTVAFTSGSATAVAIAAMLSSKLNLPFTLGATTTPGVGQYDLSGFTLAIKPTYTVSDANQGYLQVAVLTPPATYGKLYTSIYLHYSKRVIVTDPRLNISEVPSSLDGLS